MNLLTTTALNVFSANTKAKSAEINSNFSSVKSHLSDFTKDAKHGTVALQTVAKSADYTVLDDDGIHTILMTTGASDKTVTLPTAAANDGRIIKVVKVDSDVGKCLIDGESTETINGSTSTKKLYHQYAYCELQCNGTGWYVTSESISEFPDGTKRSGTGGHTYSVRATTALTTTPQTVLTSTLNKGLYLVSVSVNSENSGGTNPTLIVGFNIGGTSVLIDNMYQRVPAGFAVISFTIPIVITSDSTAINVVAYWNSATSTPNNAHEMQIVRLG